MTTDESKNNYSATTTIATLDTNTTDSNNKNTVQTYVTSEGENGSDEVGLTESGLLVAIGMICLTILCVLIFFIIMAWKTKTQDKQRQHELKLAQTRSVKLQSNSSPTDNSNKKYRTVGDVADLPDIRMKTKKGEELAPITSISGEINVNIAIDDQDDQDDQDADELYVDCGEKTGNTPQDQPQTDGHSGGEGNVVLGNHDIDDHDDSNSNSSNQELYVNKNVTNDKDDGIVTEGNNNTDNNIGIKQTSDNKLYVDQVSSLFKFIFCVSGIKS